MLNGDNNEKGKKNKNERSNNFALAAHFFGTFRCIVLHDYNVKLPSLYTFY